ncbi:MAG TPA: DNA-3-methyladenine glycosylase [Steroidobacteraceae bacterium]|nr:DNA-3-methyladenine glycosylase [Steroidobacteraceae bacterium]
MLQTLFAQHLPAATTHLRRADPVIASLIEQIPPLSGTVERDRFLALVSAIVNQQLSGRAAATIMGRLLELFPGGISPETVLETPVERLREAGLSGAKARYLVDLSARVGSGELDLERIDELDDAAVVAELTRVNGIGRWTAEMFLLFSLQRTDVLPVGDLGLRSAVRRHYNLPELPTPAEIEAIAAPWRPYSSIATLYLWRSLDPSE